MLSNLKLKLDGKLPINREELLFLVNSWGRYNEFYTLSKNDFLIFIEKNAAKERYDLSKLDVSKITNFNSIFRYSNFNGDISKWDVSNAIFMNHMFYGAEKFNSELNFWDVSNVISMFSMFSGAKTFNQNLSTWNISNVENLSKMFYGAIKFNQNINSWNISKVTDVEYMFAYSKEFNQPFLLDLSHIESCYNMFYNSIAFEKRFNNGIELQGNTYQIKEWLIKRKDKMIAFDIECSKGKDLDNFLLNLNNKDINNENI